MVLSQNAFLGRGHNIYTKTLLGYRHGVQLPVNHDVVYQLTSAVAQVLNCFYRLFIRFSSPMVCILTFNISYFAQWLWEGAKELLAQGGTFQGFWV